MGRMLVLLNPSAQGGRAQRRFAQFDAIALDLLIARRFSRLGALAMLPKLLRGTHLGDPRVSAHTFRTLKIASDTPLPLAADGEYLGAARYIEISMNAWLIMALPIN